MIINEIISRKSLKPKDGTAALSQGLLNKIITVDELVGYACLAKNTAKATCIEALEWATKSNPEIATMGCWVFVTQSLGSKAPRVKWESAKVIGNIALYFPNWLDTAIKNLLINSAHSGTVVRWSAAYALGEIIQIKALQDEILILALHAICEQEEKARIKKIYQAAFKRLSK